MAGDVQSQLPSHRPGDGRRPGAVQAWSESNWKPDRRLLPVARGGRLLCRLRSDDATGLDTPATSGQPILNLGLDSVESGPMEDPGYGG